jgi:hypothetical protein
MTPEEKLISAGWEKKATYDDPRLSEMVAVYEEIGLDVHLEPFDAENEDGCTGCMQSFPDQFKTIYTRKKPTNNFIQGKKSCTNC